MLCGWRPFPMCKLTRASPGVHNARWQAPTSAQRGAAGDAGAAVSCGLHSLEALRSAFLLQG